VLLALKADNRCGTREDAPTARDLDSSGCRR